MNDVGRLVADLRDLCERADWGHNVNEKLTLAADEIERLGKEVARLKDENGVLMERMTNMLDMTVR